MRIVVLGDIHLYQLAIWPWDLFSKRVLGQMNLWLFRRRHFHIPGLPSLIDRIDSLGADLLLGTGDLTTTATRGEFRLVTEKLGPLFARHDTVLVPGNHDRYTFTAARRRYFEHALGIDTARCEPLYRQLGDHLHLIGLDATRPNIITDRGYLDPIALMRLGEIIEPMTADDRVIVMCHYPIAMPPGRAPEAKCHALIDAAALAEALAGCGAQVLYLHGHVHEPQCWRHTIAENLTLLNAGAPLMRSAYWPHGQGFWQIDLEPGAVGSGSDPVLHHHVDAGGWRADAVAWPRRCGEVSSIG
jgi:3',5'-cyclic AMP phosphodiesterase CpdA